MIQVDYHIFLSVADNDKEAALFFLFASNLLALEMFRSREYDAPTWAPLRIKAGIRESLQYL